MKIALFGNCQAAGMASCLSALCPDLEADIFPALEARSPEVAQAFADRMAEYDLVLTQRLPAEKYGPMGTSELKATGRPVKVFPQITFTGFHPDGVLLAKGKAGRLGSYHSAIVAGAYLAGAPMERVPSLFNAYVFARLGYFDEYGRAKAFLLTHIAKSKLDGEALFARWERAGRFMYTPNHPTIATLREVAIDMCARIGVKPDLASAPPDDALARNLRLPVFPEIARRLGVPGSHETTLLSGEVLTLEELVAEMYGRYASGAPDLAEDPRIAAAAELFRAELDCAAA